MVIEVNEEYFPKYMEQLGYVKVVYCKNCIYWRNDDGFCEMSRSTPWGAYDYCSEGKKEDDIR